MTLGAVVNINNVSVKYKDQTAVRDVSFDVKKNKVYSLIGPSGCGKSSLLRSINRMNDFIEGFELSGDVLYKSQDVYASNVSVEALRRNIGIVFQKPNPFPFSIYKNVAWAPKLNGYKGDIDDLVEWSLKKAGLWTEVKDCLHKSGLSLSGGQQQRLCIARTIAMKPDVILMDEPCSALDPIATSIIEDLILELKRDFTIVIVTHSMSQARRISDYTGFLYQGKLVELDRTNIIFESPREDLTRQYISGKFG